MDVVKAITAVIFTAIIVGVIVVNGSNFNQLVTALGTFSTNTTNQLLAVQPVTAGVN
jgi:hypothetical protein